jgi:aminodeoxyfutalosine deaminase
MQNLSQYVLAVPKVELHVHLEGSIRPETLLLLARRHKVDLPADDVEGLRRWFSFTDFEHFIEVYLTITRCLRTSDDYELVAYEFGAEMARQNIRYAEVTFSPCTHHMMGIPHEVYFPGLTRGRERARRDFGVEFNWVFDIVRIARNRHWNADYTLRVALDGRADGVVALGLGGHEAPNPPGPFAPWFDKAVEAGLRSVPHAGETAGPESIWSALRELHAHRIGHGVRAVEDPELVAYLAEHRIPLEVCPTSNLRLGVYPDFSRHPLRLLHESGVPVTVSSDDPPLFGTTLSDELALLGTAFGFTRPDIDGFVIRAIRCSFLDNDRKTALESEARATMERLRTEEDRPRSVRMGHARKGD